MKKNEILTLEKAIEIRKLYKQYNGKSSNAAELAKQFGITRHTIEKIMQFKIWKTKLNNKQERE